LDNRLQQKQKLRDKVWFKKAYAQHSIQSYQSYLNAYPFGTFVAQARQQIQKLQQAEESGRTAPPPPSLPLSASIKEKALDDAFEEDWDDLESRSWLSYLSGLGGLSVSTLSGTASVRSFVNRNDGTTDEIAKGSENYSGYEIAFQRPAAQWGFYYALTPRYLFQRISIADFREELPEVKTPASTNLPAVVTDFETGIGLDPLDPNTYDIQLASMGLKGEIAYKFPWRCFLWNGCQLLGEINIGATIAENVSLKVDFGRNTVEETQWQFFQSYSLSGVFGILIPNGHSYLGIASNYLKYPRIQLPKKLEFRDRSLFNKEKQIFERERLFLDRVQLDISSVQIVYAYLF